MKRRGVWQALLFLAALTAVSCGPESEGFQPGEARTVTQTAQLRFKPIRRALVLSARAQGEAPSREALAAEGAGLRAQVMTPTQWRVMTTEQFKGYSALIIGDEACAEDGSGTLQTATDTRRIWGPIIDGNIFVIASDPSTNHTPILVERGVAFATAKEDATGLYVSLGCAYQRAAPGTSVPLLEPFGDFLVAGMGCHTAAHVFTMSPKELTGDLYGADDRLIGDGCAARTVFTHYPEQTFGTAALAVDTQGSMPGTQPYMDPLGFHKSPTDPQRRGARIWSSTQTRPAARMGASTTAPVTRITTWWAACRAQRAPILSARPRSR
jgi:large repetitive protein